MDPPLIGLQEPPSIGLGNNDLSNHQYLFNEALSRYDLLEALKQLEEVYKTCLFEERDEPIVEMCTTLMNVVDEESEYANVVFQYEARHYPDGLLFLFFDVTRKTSNFKKWSYNRTLLTPHRKRQLAKSMNPEPRVMALGSPAYPNLGLPGKNNVVVNSFTSVKVPPVYEISCSEAHTVFWCHSGRFYGAGLARNMFVSSVAHHYPEPKELDIWFRSDEKVTGVRALECGTLFETDRRWYLVGNLQSCHPYLDAIHPACIFESVVDTTASNFWVCHTRPAKSIMDAQWNDPNNVMQLKFRSSIRMIRLNPLYWSLLGPWHLVRRPIVYLLNGVQVFNLRIQNARGESIWVVYEKTLYQGTMNLVMKEKSNGDEENIDNYILFIELHEYPHPSPIVCKAVTCFDRSVLINCGDYPCCSFDHLADREERMRGNVHLFMFESIEDFLVHAHDEKTEYTIDLLIEETEKALKNRQLKSKIILDRLGKLEEQCRYLNYYGFLCYLTYPRLPSRPMKCFDSDVNELYPPESEKKQASNRFRELFAEFERVNYPGTDLWKPPDFLRREWDPQEDERSEEKYRYDVMMFHLTRFLRSFKQKCLMSREPIPLLPHIIRYLVNILRYTEALYTYHFDATDDMQVALVGHYFEIRKNVIPDNRMLFFTYDPYKLLQRRIENKQITMKDLDDPMNVLLKFRLKHEDPRVKDSLFRKYTCRMLIKAENPIFLDLIDENGVLDLNEIYPKDRRLHRIIAQTHFIGHGVTDLEGALFYEHTKLRKLGWEVVRTEKYIKDGVTRFRGYLRDSIRYEGDNIFEMDRNNPCAAAVLCSDNTTMYVHRQLFRMFSNVEPADIPQPSLNSELMRVALRGLFDRQAYDEVPMPIKFVIADWYAEVGMHEALVDLLRQIVIDCAPKRYDWLREIFIRSETLVRRFIAEHRPGILFWNHLPLPSPQISHIKYITDMWPKNEFNRMTRFPRRKLVGDVEKNVFHQMGSRQLRRWYMTPGDRTDPFLTSFYDKDFPLAKPLEISKEVEDAMDEEYVEYQKYEKYVEYQKYEEDVEYQKYEEDMESEDYEDEEYDDEDYEDEEYDEEEYEEEEYEDGEDEGDTDDEIREPSFLPDPNAPQGLSRTPQWNIKEYLVQDEERDMEVAIVEQLRTAETNTYHICTELLGAMKDASFSGKREYPEGLIEQYPILNDPTAPPPVQPIRPADQLRRPKEPSDSSTKN